MKNVKKRQLPTSLECVCCHEILVVKAFHLKFKAQFSLNTAVLEFFAVEFNCVGNHFLVLVSIFLKCLIFSYFAVILFLL